MRRLDQFSFPFCHINIVLPFSALYPAQQLTRNSFYDRDSTVIFKEYI